MATDAQPSNVENIGETHNLNMPDLHNNPHIQAPTQTQPEAETETQENPVHQQHHQHHSAHMANHTDSNVHTNPDGNPHDSSAPHHAHTPHTNENQHSQEIAHHHNHHHHHTTHHHNHTNTNLHDNNHNTNNDPNPAPAPSSSGGNTVDEKPGSSYEHEYNALLHSHLLPQILHTLHDQTGCIDNQTVQQLLLTHVANMGNNANTSAHNVEVQHFAMEYLKALQLSERLFAQIKQRVENVKANVRGKIAQLQQQHQQQHQHAIMANANLPVGGIPGFDINDANIQAIIRAFNIANTGVPNMTIPQNPNLNMNPNDGNINNPNNQQ